MLIVKLWPVLGFVIWQFIAYTTGNFEGFQGITQQWVGDGFAAPPDPNFKKVRISANDINASVTFGQNILTKLAQLESNLAKAEITVEENSPAYGLLIDSRMDSEGIQPGKNAIIAAKATTYLVNSYCTRFGITPKNCALLITQKQIHNPTLDRLCDSVKVKSCPNTPYRTFDGSCNNLNEDLHGKSYTSYVRLLPPSYLDGVQEPRRSVTKKVLPNPRLVSTSISKDMDVFDPTKTLAFMDWGQFIEHDLAHTGARRMYTTGEPIQCCDPDGFTLSPRHIHPDCMHVELASKDPIYKKHFVNCMSYVRSQPALRKDCSLGYMDQMNQATHFLDGSQIYGPSAKIADSLRTKQGGQLKNDNNYLPQSRHPELDCQLSLKDKPDYVCFRAGDSRVNAQPQLSALYTVWMREHNRIAKELEKINSNWNDETLYQEVRRIIIAILQHITFDQWSPLLFGNSNEYEVDNAMDYSSDIDPSISNSFATVGLRIFNSMTDGKIRMVDEKRETYKPLNLSDHFNRPQILTKPGYLDSIIRGLASERCQKTDLGYSKELTNNYFKDKSASYGYDILTLDIQRSRDHGLPSYNEYREVCGLKRVKKFSELSNEITPQSIKKLQSVYAHPDDIDPLIGMLAESNHHDSYVGPTLRCLFKEQLNRTRKGDRYFYTNSNQPKPFTARQIEEIRKTSLARIFCDNGDAIERMQPNVFTNINQSNNLVSCKDYNKIPKMDLEAWKVE